VVYIDTKICKGCGLCVFYCPKGVLKLSDKRNEKGYSTAEVYRANYCIGCKLCEINCPDFAVYVIVDEKGRRIDGGRE